MKINDIYPTTEYLKAADLTKPVRVKIAKVTTQTFTDPKTQEPQTKIVLTFERATKVFTLNKTQARGVAVALGSDDTDDWPGHELVLSAGIAQSGTATIVVSPVVAAENKDNPFNG